MIMMHSAETAPNPGHVACAKLEQSGKLDLLLTQNVDGLHQAAGNRRVVEAHGGTTRSRCLRCGDVLPIGEVMLRVQAGDHDPRCLVCGDGLLKADVVLFGESLQDGLMETALAAAQRCDLLVAVGTTLSVYPVAEVVPVAKQSNAKLVIVNRGPTELDDLADVRVDDNISEVLPQIFAPTGRL